ncbi:hypothetical protein L2E82_47588 [Cichorium intybus]|uniref:Uncharacterized protein n=1 Tax=Cichorium intybus TaxID=13427 RepID=A0ACB8YX50_CICIN|nr:hypothetical protein L2E82_47588 [Cichorium intybus]
MNRFHRLSHLSTLSPRKASVVAFLNGQTHLMTVDLGQGLVTSDVVNTGSGYPMLTIDDLETAFTGWFGPDEEGKRIIKVQCYSNQDTPNFYMRPIEGLTVVVDIDKKEVIKIIDTGCGIPIPKATNTDYTYTINNSFSHMAPQTNPM